MTNNQDDEVTDKDPKAHLKTEEKNKGDLPPGGEATSEGSPKSGLASSEEEEEMSAQGSGSEEDEHSRGRSRSSSRTPVDNRSPLQILEDTAADQVSQAVVTFLTLCGNVVMFGIFLVGSYDFFKNVEGNKCEMTWMYQMPNYVKIPIGGGIDEQYPMYSLYAYVEGRYAYETVSKENYQFTGIPVLYIPGNAGSHGQTRSLASVALQKYLDANTPFHFDFFTVSLNEEFSGLYGYSLQRQVEFTRAAVTRIVNLYEEFHRVVLIGHSMGGVIANSVALSEEVGGVPLSNLIYTLATPHASPVAIFDPEQDMFYHGLKRNWTRSNEENKITLVSVAGGDRDFLVPSKFTNWPFNTFQVQSTGVPGVWASTDHLCIVWCKQIVMSVVRSLFDLVELHPRNKYYAITENHDNRLGVLNYHFVQKTSGKSFHGTRNRNAVNLFKNFDQIEVQSAMYCVPSGQRSSYGVFPVEFLQKNASISNADNSTSYRVIILTTNTKDKTWIMGCNELSFGKCVSAENLSNQGKIIPHIRRRRKMVTLELSEIVQKYSHLVVKMDPHPFKTCVMIETYEESERTLQLGLALPVGERIFYNLTLTPQGFLSYLVAWKFDATPAENRTCPESHNLLAQFNHGTFQESRFLKNESLIVRYHDWNVSSSYITLFLEPTCRYNVTIRVAPLETAGQLFRLIGRLLPSFYASVILMALFFQKDPNNWSSFHIVVLSNAYRLSLFPGFLVAVGFHFIPTDWPTMMNKNEYTVTLPIICYMIAYCLVLVVSSGIWYTIITGGTVIHSVIIKVLSSRFGKWIPRFGNLKFKNFTSVTETVTEAAFEISLTRFPLTIAVILLGLSLTTCGSLGISAALVIYLVKLFKIYEDLLEDLLKAKILNITGSSLTPMNFHFSYFMLWLVVAVLNVPSLLHWTRSYATDATPQWDLSMYLCLLLLPTIAVLWQEFVPKMEPSLWNVHRYAFYGMGMACVLWGSHRLYVTAFIITFVFLTMAICQLVSVIFASLMNSSSATPQTSSSHSGTQQI